MRWPGRRRGDRQGLLPFAARSARLAGIFRRTVVVLAATAAYGLIAGSPAGRFAGRLAAVRVQGALLRTIGVSPDRAEIEAEVRIRRARSIERVRDSLVAFYNGATEPVRRLFDAAAMSPSKGIIGSGRADDAFVLSSEVYESDATGRSFRLRPGVRSVWLRELALKGAPMVLLHVPDTPDVRRAASDCAAVVVETSAQSTNSWGLRGPEPDPEAPNRVLVLGDSFMQGMFVGDDDTPPVHLQTALGRAWGGRVSVLNTGHIGYAPEQYFRTLEAFGDRFRPHGVVISVCPNDFGEGHAVMVGGGTDWDEAAYWLDRIGTWCRARAVPFLLAPAPQNDQVDRFRHNSSYPGRVSDVFPGGPVEYVDGLDAFVDEFLEFRIRVRRDGASFPEMPLYNREIGDGHFSPRGAELWSRVVARRVDALVTLARLRAKHAATRAADGGPGG